MRPTVLRSIAAISASLALAGMALQAARRPRYGGELRVEMRASIASLNPADLPADATALAAQRQWSPLVFETLVRLDDRARFQPWLAESWTHDAARHTWVFMARKNVRFHDGSVWSPPGGTISVADNRSIESILRELVTSRNAITAKAADGSTVGTGPFRVTQWDAGKSGVLAANDAYWGGRPFLDSIQIQMGRSLADQASDLQIGRADAVEIPARDLRAAKQRGAVTASMPAREVVALVFEPRVTAAVRQAVAMAVDRAPIRDVLLQQQAEISGALLPEWLSGYAFLFPTEHNVAKAKQAAGAPQSLSFNYDRQDVVPRPIAERIAVNAAEAGITLRTATGASEVRLERLPITSSNAWLALEDLATILRVPAPPVTADQYGAEKSMMDAAAVVPLFHLPQAWMLAPRVNNWPRMEDVWLDAPDR